MSIDCGCRALVNTTAMIMPGRLTPDKNEGVNNNEKVLNRRRIALTTPADYAHRLNDILQRRGAEALWCPTIVVEFTDDTRKNVMETIWEDTQSLLDLYSAIAFTSRAGIAALSQALEEDRGALLTTEGDPFVIGALGRDAQLLKDLRICRENPRVKTLVPSVATPETLVNELGNGYGRKILCPVPLVLGLDEPPVVPHFLSSLRAMGWDVVRLNAYVTRWAGPDCAQSLLCRGGIDAIVFTSTSEVQGLLKSLHALGMDWKMFRDRHPGLLVAAHGPVTASGAHRLGVEIDVVGKEFNSFNGVVDAIALSLRSNSEKQ